MDVSKIGPGNMDLVNVFVESLLGSRDFYQYDAKTDNFILKEVLDISFPGAYGFVPRTHHIDGSALDVLVLISDQAKQGIIIPSRPIGVVRLKGQVPDDVLIAVAVSDKAFESVNDVSEIDMEGIKGFLESFKKSKVEFVFGADHARRSADAAIRLYKREFNVPNSNC
jgi:inorganic pyrophosphatase